MYPFGVTFSASPYSQLLFEHAVAAIATEGRRQTAPARRAFPCDFSPRRLLQELPKLLQHGEQDSRHDLHYRPILHHSLCSNTSDWRASACVCVVLVLRLPVEAAAASILEPFYSRLHAAGVGEASIPKELAAGFTPPHRERRSAQEKVRLATEASQWPLRLLGSRIAALDSRVVVQ